MVRKTLTLGVASLVLVAGLGSPPAHAQAASKGVTLWLSTINGTLMGAVGGAAMAALSDEPEGNYEDYMVSGAGAGTLAGMLFGVLSITDLPAGGGTTGPAPAPAPQPGAAFGYDPRYGLWAQAPVLRVYPAGPEGKQRGMGLTVISGRF